MAERKTITIALMDPPYETARSTTAFRLIDIAVRRGYNVNVFAYEGAVGLPFALQRPHANAMHGRTVEEENHPLTKDWILALKREAERNGATLTWINCGLCVDERGAENAVEGVRRGSPADFLRMVQDSDNTLVIPTR
jgi:tRNA 2-thiouridine synthesizing protein D